MSEPRRLYIDEQETVGGAIVYCIREGGALPPPTQVAADPAELILAVCRRFGLPMTLHTARIAVGARTETKESS